MYAGIDYSMSCPAITIGKNKSYKSCKTFYYTDRKTMAKVFGDNIFGMMHIPYESQEERFDNISNWAMSILKKFKINEVCIEGYSMGSKGKVFHIAENVGLLKHKMWKAGIKVYEVPPTSAKKAFTGKGNSGKVAMHESFVEKTGFDISIIFNPTKPNPDTNPVSDIVDSYAMLEYGLDNFFKG